MRCPHSVLPQFCDVCQLDVPCSFSPGCASAHHLTPCPKKEIEDDLAKGKVTVNKARWNYAAFLSALQHRPELEETGIYMNVVGNNQITDTGGVSDEFPPIASHLDEIESLVLVFATVLEGRSAIYVSSPLTTGQRAFEWHVRQRKPSGAPGTHVGSFLGDVIEPNRQQAARFVQDLRARSKRVVIDPTALADVPGWTQSDYRALWARVIAKYAHTVIFRNGWHYSRGCVYEFLAALNSGVRAVREDFSPLEVGEAQSLLANAIEESRTRRASTAFLRSVLDASLTSSAETSQG